MGLSDMLLNTSAMGRPSSSCSVSKACRQGAGIQCTLQEGKAVQAGGHDLLTRAAQQWLHACIGAHPVQSPSEAADYGMWQTAPSIVAEAELTPVTCVQIWSADCCVGCPDMRPMHKSATSVTPKAEMPVVQLTCPTI